MKNYLVYLLLINIISFIFAVVDKNRAIKNRWRISENTLMFTAVLGGGAGLLFGLLLCNHKTRKKKFMVGIPVIIAAHLIAAALFFMR